MEQENESGWLVAEYDRCKPVAIVEYKHKCAMIDKTTANNKTIANLGTMAGLPSFIVVYDPDNLLFKVIALNEVADKFMGHEDVTYNERDYQEFLRALRR